MPANFLTAIMNQYEAASLRPLQIHVPADGLVAGHQVSPVLGVMVGVNEGEYRMIHVPHLVAAGKIDEIEFYRLSVGDFRATMCGRFPASQ